MLIDVIHRVHLIPTNHKLVLHHIHHLRPVSMDFAAKALKIYIVQRLALHDDTAWVDASLLTLIWMLTTCAADPVSVTQSELEAILNDTCKIWTKGLSLEATHGALVLLWKSIGDTAKSNRHVDTVRWCRIALHKMFSNAEDDNIGKLERYEAWLTKLQRTDIEQHDDQLFSGPFRL